MRAAAAAKTAIVYARAHAAQPPPESASGCKAESVRADVFYRARRGVGPARRPALIALHRTTPLAR
ncbi:hypothetical protein RR42_m1550 [Cupriavidus basilensis]|uniref:Uncharacterized protein n=1 Tax=Cupriavidus basilensis TaxID=68895 RepID=A0A0C4Y7K9_9BURK|nr:hypothetical protein RR42_m1550 [Cupriavidus basilensis]